MIRLKILFKCLEMLLIILSFIPFSNSIAISQSIHKKGKSSGSITIKIYKKDQASFIKSLELYFKANNGAFNHIKGNWDLIRKFHKESNVDSCKKFFEGFDKEHYAIIDLYNQAIRESEKVSDKYLEYLHPELRAKYRDNFIPAVKLSYEYHVLLIRNNYKYVDPHHEVELLDNLMKTDKMLKTFWNYILSIQNDLHNSHPKLENKLLSLMKH